jgi:hypothetical protein
MDNNQASNNTSALKGPSELSSAAWKFFAANWKILALIALVPAGVRVIASLFAITIVGLPIAFILVICSAIVTIPMFPALIGAIQRLASEPGAKLSVKEQYMAGFRLFWPFLLVIILKSLTGIGSLALFVIPGIIVGVYISMYMFTFMIDGRRGFAALTESYVLVRGRWWGVFGRSLFLVLIMIGAGIILSLVSLVLVAVGGILGPIVINLIVYAFFIPFAFSYMYQLYLSLKATRLPDAPTSTFKNWLVAFLIIGIIAIIVIPVLLVSLALTLVSHSAYVSYPR